MIQTSMPQADDKHLVRAIGRWSLAALVVNSVVGSGVFGLPAPMAKLAGTASPWIVVLAGAAIGVIMACFAEVASRFTEAGGPYLYSRVAFGQLIGIEVGWLFWLTRIAAPAANMDLFATYLAEFWPRASAPVPRFFVLTLLIGALTVINLRGVKAGARTSNVFTAAKLIPLGAVAIVGSIYLAFGRKVAGGSFSGFGTHSWMGATLLMVFAYGGFDTALIPMGEARNPRRDVVFGLFTALVTCTVLYAAIQWVVIGMLPNPAQSARPLAEVARILFGRVGAVLVTIGALVSVVGYLSANVLGVPRITFALAERGDFPKLFAVVHPKTHTPYVSILVFAFLAWLLALFGNFSWNVTLSAVARLLYYALTCAALLALRKKDPSGALFRLPGGTVLAVLGILICIVLLWGVDRSGMAILAATVLIGLVNWLVMRKSPALVAAGHES